MKKPPPIARQIQGLRDNLHSMGVAQLWLFGSAARGEEESQDVDLLVEFVSPPTLLGFMGLKFFLEEKLGKPVDLHTKSSCPERFLRRIQTETLHVA
jgi:predicted nucleotidyltransferase